MNVPAQTTRSLWKSATRYSTTVAALLTLGTFLGPQARASEPLSLGLREALEVAHDSSATLEAARYRIAESEGDVATAAVRLADNPEFVLAAGPRTPTGSLGSSSTDPSSTDLSLGLEQRFELRGQRRLRTEEAESRLGVARYEAQDARRVADLAVALTFFEVLARTSEVELREEDVQLSTGLFDLAQRRLELGEGTPLEVNTARLRRAAAQRHSLIARSAQRLATFRLAQLLGVSPSRQLLLEGELPVEDIPQSEAELLAIALETRPDLRAMGQQAEAAKAAAELADRKTWSGLDAGIAFEREGGDEIVLGSIRLALPVANRYGGERSRSEATVERVLAEGRAVHLAIESDVRTAFAEYVRARKSLDLYDADVLSALEESLGLLERALAAGEVGYAEVLIVQREVLEGRAEHLETRLALAQARALLLAAAHLSQIDPLGETP